MSSSSCLIMTSSDFYSKFIDNKNETDKYNNTNDDDTSSSSVNNNESLASSLASSSSSSSPLLLNKKRKMISNIHSMNNKKRQRRRTNNSVRVQRVVQFVPNSKLMTDVAFPRNNAAIPHHTRHQKKAKMTRMNQGEEDEDEHHQSSTTNQKNDALWYTAQEMQTFKYSFIRDVKRYERQQKRRQCCCDYNSINDGGADDADSEGLERYTTYNRVRRRQKRKVMVQICQAVQTFEQSTLLLPTTKVPPLTDLLGQLLQRYHQSQQRQS